jgi:RNA polymerase sigma-70 factor (ECF subfamily)
MSKTGTVENSSSAFIPVRASGRHPAFVTTHWSVVLSAGRNDTTRARAALARLCETYWFPLYAYVRRRGHSPHDGQDLTQEFFTRLLERQAIAGADPERGRFRSFLLTALNHFLINEWAAARTQKRGGGAPLLSLDLAAAEARLDLEPADHATPDKAFEKQWAVTLLNQVLNQLEAEYRRAGKVELFTALQKTLAGRRESQPYAELAVRLHLSEGAIKVAVHRLRRRYRHLIRAEIAHTLDPSADIDEEMRCLFRALAES